VIAALEDTLEQLSLLSCIPAAADPSFLSQIDDLGLTDTVKQLWQIEESLRLTVSDHYSEAIDDDPGSDIILGRLNTTTHKLCRYLKVRDNSRWSPTPPSKENCSLLSFQQYLANFTEIASRQLSTTVEENAADKQMWQELTQKELILTQGAKALQQKLEIQRREQDKEVSAHQQILLKIRAELQDMVQHNETKMAMVNSRMEDQITRSAERHAGSYEQLAAKIGSLESQIEAEHQSYRDTEANLRKKKERVEVDLAAHIAKYDEDMCSLLNQTKKIENEKDLERDQLIELETHFLKIDTNHKFQSEEIAVLSTLQQRRFFAKGKLHGTITNIQRVARGEQARTFTQQLRNKKIKKKGK
jgi:hypothetical protein